MKDLEKIKSENLACQVADANPANFAIEQEVAQLVGATVPAPTEPSADDARELGAQLLVFLRRALLPIRSALRTAVATIYAHLDSRCTDYTPAAYASFTPTHHAYDPMGSTPRTLPNLLTALTAFDGRKISGVPEAEDGISLVHLLANSTANATIKELTDNTTGWELSTFDKIKSAFPGLERMHLNCIGVIWDGKQIKGWQALKIVDAPNITELRRPRGDFGAIINNPALEQVLLPGTTVAHCAWSDGPCIYQCTNMWKLVLGTLTEMRYVVWEDSVNLIHLEIGANTAISMDWGRWSPTYALDPTGTDLIEEGSTAQNNLQQFLQNFKDHIALRLTDQGSGLTLTLSQAVFSAVIEGSSPICDDIKGIIEDKGWKVQDTNNNIFPTT